MIPLGILQGGLDAPAAVGPFLNGNLPSVTPGGTSNWSVVPAFTNLTFTNPLVLTPDPRPETNLLYMGQRDGKIYAFLNDPSTSTKTLFGDISDRVAGNVWDGGLLGMEFHPDFGPAKPYVYVYYSARQPNASYSTAYQGAGYPGTFFNVWSRLSRFTVNLATNTLDTASEQIMINRRLYNGSHRGGGMAFGNDGYLYVAMGDEFRYTTAQDMVSQLEGGVLRLDVDSNPATSHAPIRKLPLSYADEVSGVGYYIPNDNPFLSPGGAAFEEYYTLGHRNPHRMTYDPVENRFWIGEVGGNYREEVNVLVAGGNFGHPFKEGSLIGPYNPPSTIQGTVYDPVTEFTHGTEMNVIIGGYVYRGSAHPALTGRYICGSYDQGDIYALTYDPFTNEAEKELLATMNTSGLCGFGQDLDGELYFFSQGNNVSIQKLSAAVAPNAPEYLSQTGAFSDLATMTPAPGVIPYELIEPFWSDKAEKYRWVAIPNDGNVNSPGEQITYSETSDWVFPAGTVTIKHFEMVLDETNPTVRRRLETRFLVHGQDGKYYGLTYRWEDNQLDARLLSTSVKDTFVVQTATFPREEEWYYPARSECLVCHNTAAFSTLGPITRQLNKAITYPQTGRTHNQIATLEYLNFFSPDADTNNLTGLLTSSNKYDLGRSLEDRARTYLDANCSSCHRPGTGNRATLDLRQQVPLDAQGLVYGRVIEDIGIHDSRAIIPGDTARSVVYQRIKAVHTGIAMPPLAKNKVDTAGVRLIGQWIMSMAPAGHVAGTGLRGQYYDNENFTNLVATQVDPKVDFYWGLTGPAPMQFPHFYSVRWTGYLLPLHSETYTFSTYSDDGVIVTINNQQLFGTLNTNGINNYAGNIALTAGVKVPITVEYIQGSGLSFIELYWESASQPKEIVPTRVLFPTGGPTKNQRITFAAIPNKTTTDGPFALSATASSGLPVSLLKVSGPATVSGNMVTLTGAAGEVVIRATQAGGTQGGDVYAAAPEVERSFFVSPPNTGQGNGLLGTYYHNADLTNAAFTRTDENIDFYWGSFSPAPSIDNNTFSVRWEGDLEPPFSETYTFTTTTDDGVRLYVNNQLLIDAWGDQPQTQYSAQIALTGGVKVPIRMEYYEGRAYALARLNWSSPSVPPGPVPQQFLYSTPIVSFPVEFIHVEARPTDQQAVEVRWSTASEQNSAFFVVERSADGEHFQGLEQVAAAGQSQVRRDYSSLDRHPHAGRSYYRIRQVDSDGSFSYSNQVAVTIDPDRWISVSPNPTGADRRVHVSSPYGFGTALHYYVIDPQGRLVARGEIPAADLRQGYPIDLSGHSPGVYLLRIAHAGQQSVRKIVVRQ
ncbi:MAG: hypothetical protein OHK0039_33020 [Bacteroidia bacterium]